MTYKEYEIIVEKLEERLDCGLITESTAEAINSYCYDKYMESYVDEMCDALEDEYDESTALSRHLYDKEENIRKKIDIAKNKQAEFIKLLRTVSKDSKQSKLLADKIQRLEDEITEYEKDANSANTYNTKKKGENLAQITAKARQRNKNADPNTDIMTYGTNAKRKVIDKYDTKPAKPREPGIYKKINDNIKAER